MSSSAGSVGSALRLGWAVAEVRGRNWPQGPRPTSTALPARPGDVLPLRSQRAGPDARRQSAMALVSLASQLGMVRAAEFEAGLTAALPPFDPDGEAALVDGGEPADGEGWRHTAEFFLRWDARFQDELSQRGEHLANGYLLGRGLAESYWGLGPDRVWTVEGEQTAVSLGFLFGPDRREELTRMLGRLGQEDAHSVTAAAISGSLEAWGAVAENPTWATAPDLRVQLYEQVRRWYQLLVLGQDPTTLIRPYAKLTSLRTIGRAVRLFWPQAVLAVLALGLITAFFAVAGDTASSWLSPLLAMGGFGAFAVAGILARGQSAAQRLVTRIRQDAYTDLVALSVTSVPALPAVPGEGGPTLRQVRTQLESAVRRRLLTPPTAPPQG